MPLLNPGDPFPRLTMNVFGGDADRPGRVRAGLGYAIWGGWWSLPG